MTPQSPENQNVRCRCSLPSTTNPELPFGSWSQGCLGMKARTICLCHQLSWLVSTHSSRQSCSWPSPLSFYSKNTLCTEVTHWDLWSCPSVGIGPFTQGDFLVGSKEHANQNLSYLNSESWGTEQYHHAVQCGVALQVQLTDNLWCWPRFPFVRPALTSSDICPLVLLDPIFQSLGAVLGHLPLIWTTILKSWCHVLSVRRLNLREMESPLYVREMESERTGIVSHASMTRL